MSWMPILFYPDGPSLTAGPDVQVAIDGEPLSLLCATDLLSNPEPTITWTNPSGKDLANDNPRIQAITDSNGVRLEFLNTTHQDSGIWRCGIRVEGTDVLGPGGAISPSLLIGEETVSINLIVVGKF